MKNILIIWTAVAVSVSLTGSVAAQEGDTVKLDTVVISASKTPLSRAQLTQSVTVLSGDDLRARGIARVSDALQAVPGVSIAQNGSFGSVTSLFLRGGESRYTKILVDGVAVNQSGGYFDFSHLTTDNVERIEIVRGPASVLYGADAMTGVIQIFTRRGSGPLSVNADMRAGTYDTRDAEVGFGGSSQLLSFSLAGAHHHTDGLFDFNNNYDNGTLSGSLGLTFHPGTEAALTARYGTAEFHYPTDFTGAPVDTNSYRVQHRLTLSGKFGTAFSNAARLDVIAGTNEVWDLTEDIAIPFLATAQVHTADNSRAHRRSLEARLGLVSSAAANLNIGGELVLEAEKSTNSRGPIGSPTSPTSEFDADRTTRGAYIELLGSPQRLVSYTAAARVDDNSDYGSHTTYRLGARIPIGLDIHVRGSLSTAFNAPAFNQIRPTLFTTGSPGLSPERSRSWEIGIDEDLENEFGRVSLVYFHQRFEDLIQFVPGGPPTFLGGYANLTEARSNGYEAEVVLTPHAFWSATASYTQAVPKVARVSPSYSGSLAPGDALIRRPTHSGSASVTLRPRRGSITAIGTYVGKRPDLDFNEFPSPTITLPSYLKIDVAGSIDVWRGSHNSSLSLTGRVENALDKEYETILHFPAPGRVILVGARFGGSL